MAKAQDEATQKRFSDSSSELSILTKSKQELTADLPASDFGNDIATKPESIAIKQALDHIDSAKK